MCHTSSSIFSSSTSSSSASEMEYYDYPTCSHDSTRFHASLLTPSPDSGTPYPHGSTHLNGIWHGPTRDDMIENDRREQHNPETFFPHLEAATQHLETLARNPTYLSTPKTTEVAEAHARLSWLSALPTWTPDIIYKAFDDLDLALFAGALRGYCTLRWDTVENLITRFQLSEAEYDDCYARTELGRRAPYHFMPKGEHEAFATTFKLPWETAPGRWREAYQAQIYMNATKHFLDPLEGDRCRWHEMWGSLLHEMVHAYFRVVVVHDEDNKYNCVDPCDPDGDHGVHFQRCVMAVNRRAEELGLEIGAVFAGVWTVPRLSGDRDEYGRVREASRKGFGGCEGCDAITDADTVWGAATTSGTSTPASSLGSTTPSSRPSTPASDVDDADGNYGRQLAKISAAAKLFVPGPPTKPTKPEKSLKERLSNFRQAAEVAKKAENKKRA